MSLKYEILKLIHIASVTLTGKYEAIFLCDVLCGCLPRITFDDYAFAKFSRFINEHLCEQARIPLSPNLSFKNPAYFHIIFIVIVEDNIATKETSFLNSIDQRLFRKSGVHEELHCLFL